MDNQRRVQLYGGACVPLGILLAGLGVMLAKPVGIGIGVPAAVGGGTLYRHAEDWWPQLEQWGAPDVDFGRRNTLFRGLVQLGLTVVTFGLVVGALRWLGIAILFRPAADTASVLAAIGGGIGLGGGLPVIVAQVDSIRRLTDTPSGRKLTFQIPNLVFAVLLVFVPGTGLIFASSYVGSRLVLLPLLYVFTAPANDS